MLRELDYREASGLKVSLSLDTTTDQLVLIVTDNGKPSQHEVPKGEARFAFEHPFAWMGGFGARR